MTKLLAICLVTFSLVAACSKKAGDATASSDDPTRKATPEECQHAYEHLADLKSADGKMSKADLMQIEKGNIEHCPHMATKASIDCLLAINAPADKVVAAEMDCATKK